MSLCKGFNKKEQPCKFKAKDGLEGYCTRCFKYKEIFENIIFNIKIFILSIYIYIYG